MTDNIIRAQFMHQHRDKAMYESEIVLDTPTLNQYYNKPTSYLDFDILIDFERPLIMKWFNSSRNSRITRRSLRFIGSGGTILCELPKRALRVNVLIPESFFTDNADIPTIHVRCIVEKDEIKELGKIFFPKYFVD